MRDYIILNGKNSNEIDGLLIQILPPISKPLMRNTIETIDGKDGDQITKLGYSAYNKQVSIGLYGDYDINEIIKYFDSEGKIIFSNEEDKFYYYTILDQIDFEKLIRFRTATITFHVQPFKYPVEEEPIDGQLQYVTGTGSNISLDNTANSLFNKLDLKGNTEQNGTPTPAAPVNVEVVTGENTIEIVGKNLFDYSTNIITNAYPDNGQMKIVSDNNCNLSYVRCKPNTTYTISRRTPIAQRFAVVTTATLPDVGTALLSFDFDNAGESITITTPSNANYIVVRFIYNEINDYETYAKTIQVEYGSTASPYEEYQSQSYTIDFGNLEFCGFGEYQDYPHKLNGTWYKHAEFGKLVLDGTQNITLAGSGVRRFNANYTTLGISNIKDGTSNAETANYRKNSHFQYSGSNSNWGNYYMYSNWLVLFDVNSVIANASDLSTWFSNNNTNIYYVLATPTEIEITDEDLIEQLENLKLATSYEGQTHISHEYSNAPVIFDVAAVQLGSDKLIIDNIGNIYARPTLNLEGTGIVNIYLEENQMFQVDMSDNNNIVIDTNKMEAYNPTNGALMNRKVVGNYNNFKLNAGENTLKFSGDLSNIEVTNYVRWL